MLPAPHTRFSPTSTCAHPLLGSTDAAAALVHDIALAASILSDCGCIASTSAAVFDTILASFDKTIATFATINAASDDDCTQQHQACWPPPTGLHPPLCPPPSNTSIIHRKITSTTYRRRMFLTSPLAHLFGFDANAVQACRLLGRRLSATLVDANTGQRYAVLYEPRPGKTITGELSGEWSRFAHNVRVGDVIEFSMWKQGRDAGQYGACARVLWAAG